MKAHVREYIEWLYTPVRDPLRAKPWGKPIPSQAELQEEMGKIGLRNVEPVNYASGYRFNRGDFVRLKSGGPLMKVVANDQGHVICTWMDETLMAAAFPPETLKTGPRVEN